MKIKFLQTNISAGDIRRVVKAVRSNHLISGPFTQEIEQGCAAYFNAPTAVFMSSATAALHIGLLLAGVKAGDEVITTPISWVATTNVILLCGAKPVFVDVEPLTGLMDVTKVEAAITPRTKAILPVHLYGQMVDMRALAAIAKKHNLEIIEDSAHAFESTRDGVRPTELSLAACFSFHATKNMAAGQSGMLVTRHKQHEETIRALINQGVVRDKTGLRHMTMFGYKYASSDIAAALLVGQLDRLAESHGKRVALHERYEQLIRAANIPNITLLQRVPHAEHGSHLFTLLVSPKLRLPLIEAMAARGVPTHVHYEAIHLEPFYQQELGIQRGAYPCAEGLGDGILTLPLYSKLTFAEQDYVVKTLAECMQQLKASPHAA
jgi:dTDP-4-amino-4,6-dideoxygalactose transaminase